uniref:Uncharacterized protein n=1 Tax=Lactuca sativa TaxID=4236 RepID=A0A9R1VDW8_LACSA|nr:hypothetical protein LSAT_V11C500246000 [Lactuca sativa]
MSERTGRECTYLFCQYVIELYRDIYLQHLTKVMSNNCMPHIKLNMVFQGCLEWAIYPNVWHGEFTRGDQGFPTDILEVVVSHDLWFWHAFFGMTGSNNNRNVIQVSPLFNNILHGKAPDMLYVVNGNEYKYGYYLGDEIYLEYAIIVKSYSFPTDENRKLFKLAQESAWKDVERAFGVL